MTSDAMTDQKKRDGVSTSNAATRPRAGSGVPSILIRQFRARVWAYYREHARDLPWRHTFDPYAIWISEVMLQQTQVCRVMPKYHAFLGRFPTLADLAAASPVQILTEWQGLGYNRRALALHRTANIVESEYSGLMPRSPAALARLPGIGRATAGAICTYAYGLPVAFIETNVRAAFIHDFFQECSSVSDADILPLVELALDHDNPRDWYYALTDYGAWVKKAYPNPGRRSKHYAVQSPFKGSRRQARATALRVLLGAAPLAVSLAEMRSAEPLLAKPAEDELLAILEELCAEGFLAEENGRFRIA